MANRLKTSEECRHMSAEIFRASDHQSSEGAEPTFNVETVTHEPRQLELELGSGAIQLSLAD